jgi:hypothetical protein
MYKRNQMLAAAVFTALSPLAASAATLCVNPGGTGGCLASIGEALGFRSYDNDVIDVAAGVYFEGGLFIDSPVQIRGAGMNATIIDGMVDGANGPQVLRYSAWGGSGDSSLSNLTVRHGRRGIDTGRFNRITLDGVRVTENGPESGAGIINNAGRLTVRNSLIDGNFATDNGSVAGCDWGGGSGGGIAALCGGGVVHVYNSAIVNNTASRWGGGLILVDGETVIENSTISGNAANFPDAGLGGGALFVGGAFPDVAVRFSTIANNAAVGAGGIWSGFPVKVFASLLQGNAGRACVGGATMVSLGYNVVSDDSCALGATGDAGSTNAQLEPLASNGGSLPTHAVQMTSAAVDRVPLAACDVTTDQDGVARPQHGACDSGAYEHVFTAAELIAILLPQVAGVGPGSSVTSKLTAALALASSGNSAAACSTLGALRNEVNAQAGKKITVAQAAAILAAIQEVTASLGC